MFDITLTLKRAENISNQIQEWWIVNQTELSLIEKQKFGTGLEVYVFSDQVSPPSLGFLAGYGYVVIGAALVLSETSGRTQMQTAEVELVQIYNLLHKNKSTKTSLKNQQSHGKSRET